MCTGIFDLSLKRISTAHLGTSACGLMGFSWLILLGVSQLQIHTPPVQDCLKIFQQEFISDFKWTSSLETLTLQCNQTFKNEWLQEGLDFSEGTDQKSNEQPSIYPVRSIFFEDRPSDWKVQTPNSPLHSALKPYSLISCRGCSQKFGYLKFWYAFVVFL